VAERELKVLGRNGQLPWLLDDAVVYIPYCKAARLVKSSPAHALLHGIVKPIVAYGVLASRDEVPLPDQWGANPVVFDYKGRAILAVRSFFADLRLCLVPQTSGIVHSTDGDQLH
jgi:hypothetical protein